MDDAELERAMRDGLERRAALADDSVPVTDRARTAARRRRGGRIAIGLVAASVAAVSLVGVVLDDDPSRPSTSASDGGSAADPGAAGWRTEYWADLAVDVPADWGWGSAPPVCGPRASRTVDGRRVVAFDEAVPYVGRPLAQTDMCASLDGPPPAPYVWLGADVETGTVDLGDDWVQETVEVNGSRLTVATDDPALRARILGSARGGAACLSEVEVSGTLDHDGGVDATRQPSGLRVCVYRTTEAGEAVARLAYAAVLGAARLASYRAARGAGEQPRDQCPSADVVESEWVVLEQVTDDGTVTDRDVVHLVCPGIDLEGADLGGFETVRLMPEMVAPWAVGGVPAVVYGPSVSSPGFADYVIGGLG
ncbi:hypothetical protein [Nocardioides sp.]|uniref:hypothetical protein n=1 Tax=Nocardioides sp. TaxID=35761 RepID=UPI00286B2F4A|nr:hypothetical protein [Nocardioides sp.]